MRKMEMPELEMILLAGGDVITTSECIAKCPAVDPPPPCDDCEFECVDAVDPPPPCEDCIAECTAVN